MADEKAIERLLKLLALAQRGVGGEKATAQRFLDATLAKHGMTMADLLDSAQPVSEVKFTHRGGDEFSLLNQVLFKVKNVATLRYRKRGKAIWIELTAGQRAEVQMHMAILLPALRKHMKTAMTAFVHANALYPANPTDADDGADDPPEKPMSKEDRDALIAMIASTRATAVHKAIAA